MEYQVEVRTVESQTTAVVRRRARPSELAEVVPRACGEVWAFIRSAGLPHPGQNLALYLNGEGDLECGVEVAEPFAGDGSVVCSSTPAGLVATAAHWGPYDRLHEAHEAIRNWCAAQGHQLTETSWEVYGDWDDDPAKLRTDVFYLLRGPGESAG